MKCAGLVVGITWVNKEQEGNGAQLPFKYIPFTHLESSRIWLCAIVYGIDMGRVSEEVLITWERGCITLVGCPVTPAHLAAS